MLYTYKPPFRITLSIKTKLHQNPLGSFKDLRIHRDRTAGTDFVLYYVKIMIMKSNVFYVCVGAKNN
jgi:hypothetical protein